MPASVTAPVPQLVLDTNVVLDWLLFHDPSCHSLADALTTGRACWLSTAAMRDELMHVLGRGSLAKWQPDIDAIQDAYSRWSRPIQAGSIQTPARLRCTDPDDQKFIDLAWQLGNSRLLSRDRAVLKLARRARAAGFAILVPEAWSDPLPAGG